MRLVPIISALLVMAAIYVFVFEREQLLSHLSNITTQTADESEAGAQAAQPAAEPSSKDGTGNGVHVVAVRSRARAINTDIVLRGQTQANRQVELQAETSGRIISDPLRKGAFVEEGQLLCELDPGTREAQLAEARARLSEARARVPEAEARLNEAQSRLEEARINDNAARQLSEEGFASETRVASTRAAVSSAEAAVQTARSGLESGQSGIQSAQAAVAAAEEEIERLKITAPFGGVLESDTAELGSLLQPGAPCATVIQLDPITIIGFVSETAVNQVTLGAKAEAEMANGVKATGEVTFLSRRADPNTRTFRVDIRVPNPDLILRDGQSAEIRVEAEGRDAHLLPQSALTLNDEGDLGVRLVTDAQEAAFTPVTLLRDSRDGAWLAGLPDQADVIIIGHEYVNEGVRVAPTYQDLDQ